MPLMIWVISDDCKWYSRTSGITHGLWGGGTSSTTWLCGRRWMALRRHAPRLSLSLPVYRMRTITHAGAGERVTTGSLEARLMGGICHFLMCKYSHHGRFKLAAEPTKTSWECTMGSCEDHAYWDITVTKWDVWKTSVAGSGWLNV